MPGPYRQHLADADDLVTTQEATRAGFVALALEKNRQSTPTVEEARALHAAASRAGTPTALATMTELESALLTAAGVSEKATSHLAPEDRAEAIRGLITNFLQPAGAAFVDELVYRFLLIRGDSMGGSMRNIVGILARRRLTRATLAALNLTGKTYQWLHAVSRSWIPGTGADVDIEQYVRAISWPHDGAHRVLAYNVNVPLVRKNIDISLLNSNPSDALSSAYRVPNAYLALGELKGGIDPAGADEHWKTANIALSRIRGAFTHAGSFPNTFFVGAAIVSSMSREIWDQLESGQLTNAANLTNAAQLASLCTWLVGL